MSRRGVPIMAGMSSRRWKPAVTVAAVIEQAGRYLLVEERTAAGLQLNTPAGHLEPGESPQAGAVREATNREFVEQTWLRKTEDFAEGIRSVNERRVGNFVGR